LAQFLKAGESNILGKTVELTGKTKEGNEIPIETSLSFRKTGKERYIFTAFIRDITFQKKVERKLVENAKELKTINKDLENFVYIVSHDLKEPLFTIEGYMARLSRIYKDALEEKGNLCIERIKINIGTMSQKIKEITEVLRVGRITYDFKSNDSGAITTEVVSSLDSRIKRNKINVSIHDKLPTIVCDENRMKDILSNLIINAIKFMGEDEQRQISIGCDKNGNDYYKFYVEDTGIGIRKEYQEQIFTIFRRLKEIDAEGTGVGLSIVKKIVEQHKGSIWIESPVKDGKGTRFCFTIPVTRETSGYQEIQDNATQSDVQQV
jgi:light-regulated signal transduction histidine kinase (bacteriophytochrome)